MARAQMAPLLAHPAVRGAVFRGSPFLFEAGDEFSAANARMVSDLLDRPPQLEGPDAQRARVGGGWVQRVEPGVGGGCCKVFSTSVAVWLVVQASQGALVCSEPRALGRGGGGACCARGALGGFALCVCVCVCVCACMHMCVCVFVCACAHMCLCTCVRLGAGMAVLCYGAAAWGPVTNPLTSLLLPVLFQPRCAEQPEGSPSRRAG